MPDTKIPIRMEMTPHLAQKIFCPAFDESGVSFILDIPFTLALFYFSELSVLSEVIIDKYMSPLSITK